VRTLSEILTTIKQEDSSDGFEYLSDDSPLKGKGPAPRKGASQEVIRAQDEFHDEAQNEVQDEVQSAVQVSRYRLLKG